MKAMKITARKVASSRLLLLMMCSGVLISCMFFPVTIGIFGTAMQMAEVHHTFDRKDVDPITPRLVHGKMEHISVLAFGQVTYAGTEYGGWAYLSNPLRRRPVIYSIGLGHDLSWDVHMLEKHPEATIFGFDGTPVHLEWWGKGDKIPNNLQNRFVHSSFLLSDSDGPVTLALPKGHGVSYAMQGLLAKKEATGSVTLQGKTLETLAKLNGHSVGIDILKMDIEGAEYDVLNSWSTDIGLPPICQLLVEFHDRLITEEKRRNLNRRATLNHLITNLNFHVSSVKFSFAGDPDGGISLFNPDACCEMNPTFCALAMDMAHMPLYR